MEICIKWNMCRTCTTDSTSKLQSLFDDVQLAQQLKEYAGIQVKPNDGLPDKICTDCVQSLQSAHVFLTSVRRSDAHLRSVVRRTMSTGKCFSSIAIQEEEQIGNSSKAEAQNRTRKQNILERNLEQKVRCKTKFVNTLLGINSEGELSNPDSIEPSHLSNTHSNGLPDNEGKFLDFVKSEETITSTTAKSDGDYLLVVSKCGLNVVENMVVENDCNEYILTNVDDNDDEYENEDNDYSEKDTHSAEVENKQLTDIQLETETKSVLKLKQLKQPASAVPSLTVDLAAACEPSSFPKHSCSVCGNSFPNQTQLKSHMRIHRNEKSYECELCFKRFNAACNLTTHMRTHTGEKPFQCTHCGRRFADRSTHRKHERMHTNERPYACNICAKTFSLSTTLKAHFLSHSKEKPHKCLTCNKGFRLPHQLKAHERTHVHRYEVGIMLYNQDEGEYAGS